MTSPFFASPIDFSVATSASTWGFIAASCASGVLFFSPSLNESMKLCASTSRSIRSDTRRAPLSLTIAAAFVLFWPT